MAFKHEFSMAWYDLNRRAKRRGHGVSFSSMEECYAYCVSLGWKKGMAVCRGTKDNPDTGDYGIGNIYIDTPGNNTVDASQKSYAFVSPDGVLHTGKNIRQFCRDNGLDMGAIWRVIKGTRNHHKGWTLPKEK